jgi:RimJ/RimL family protein N-acetyltransferase
MNFAEDIITTGRLLVEPMSPADSDFIFELVNTAGWLKFIGNRNITSLTDADNYIKRILENSNVFYWVATLKNTTDKLGVVTYIKRDYLDHHDIGFAFLPRFANNGYAYEATNAVLHHLIKEHHLKHILATTIPENIRSVKLLKKIGLTFEKEIEISNEKLHVYGANAGSLKM